MNRKAIEVKQNRAEMVAELVKHLNDGESERRRDNGQEIGRTGSEAALDRNGI